MPSPISRSTVSRNSMSPTSRRTPVSDLVSLPAYQLLGNGNPHVLVRIGHGGEETLYVVKQVQQRVASSLGHVLLYLAPAE